MNRPQEYIYHQLVNVSYWSKSSISPGFPMHDPTGRCYCKETVHRKDILVFQPSGRNFFSDQTGWRLNNILDCVDLFSTTCFD